LDAGAFGRVFECTDEWGNSLVAKVLVPLNQTYEEVRESWLQELSHLRCLRHPNITYVHAAFEYRHTFYIIIERCAVTLREFIALPETDGEDWFLHVARDILHGLEFIHGEGFVHKDLHAGNVLLTTVDSRIDPDAVPEVVFKISDFGISKLEGNIRPFGTVMAVWMMPPECLDPAKYGQVGKHTDIYHTGLLLLSLLTKNNYHFTPQQVLDAVPRRTAESLPSPYGPVIAKALRRRVSARPPSAIQFWRELRDAEQSVSGRAGRMTVVRNSRSRGRVEQLRPSFFGEFTSAFTSLTAIRSAGYGFRSA
jgi:serine/threonine-protein kinase